MHVMILGCRGIPANHGGFETFAEDLAVFLTGRGHNVTVYCHASPGKRCSEDLWNGIRRVHIPAQTNPFGTLTFDWKAILHSSKQKGVVLNLGYNTAFFNSIHRLRGVPCVMNMDGIEWKRQKWTLPQRVWLWMNEIWGATIANHLVADHPEISKHLQRHTPARKITTIYYGAEEAQPMDESCLQPYGIKSKEYYLVIARPEPENSILTIVSAYSKRPRHAKLVVLGNYIPNSNPYHRKVMDESSPGVCFLGSIYSREIVQALRFHAKGYIHGHTVGGTNPSLVEALAAGNAIISHDNRFNRWVAGKSAQYFGTTDSLARILDRVEDDPALLLTMENGSRQRHREQFMQQDILASYEEILLRFAGLGQEAAQLLPEMRSKF